jgi:hypothetical protein
MISMSKKDEKILFILRELPYDKKMEVLDFVTFLQSYKKTKSVKKDNKSKKIKVNALKEIDNIAIDTGINDLAFQHDHYIYGTPKK